MISKKLYTELETLIERLKKMYECEPDMEKHSQYAITYNSTAIEWSALSANEVADLLDIGKPAKNREFFSNLMVFDHHNALIYAQENAIQKQPITETLIKTISAMVMKNTGSKYKTSLGEFDSSNGDYRLVGVHAGRKTFPDYKKVPSMMKQLIAYINNEQKKQTINVFSLAIEIHFRFVSIHPFADGNWRVARLLMNYILAYYGFPMLIVFKSDKIKYIDTLYKAQETEDITPLYDFMFKQYIKFVKHEIARSK